MAGLVKADPTLAALPGALDGAARRGWTLHDVQWVAGRHCRLAWRVPGAVGSASTYQAGLVDAEGCSSYDYRSDPLLPSLGAASDESVVAPRLAEVVGHPLTECRVQPVRYRPGSRCVLRYDVAGPAGKRTFYAKVLDHRQFADTAAALTQLARSATPTGLVAPLVAVWGDLHVVLTAAVPGRSVSAVLRDPAVPPAERLHTADRLGRLLAQFQALDAGPVPTRSAGDQLDELQELGACVAAVDEALDERYSAILAALRADAPSEPVHPALTHGGFRAGQVVLTPPGTLTLLDLDGVGHGDPARDLATAAGHLVWQATKQPDQAGSLGLAEGALVHGHQGRAPAVDPSRLRWWRAAAILQVAGRRYRRLELADWELVPALLDRAAEPVPARRLHGRTAVGDELLDLHRMTEILTPALRPIAAAPPDLRVTSAQELALAPGRRRVVQYTVAGLDAGRAVDVVAKTFQDRGRAELLHQHLRVLSAGPFASGRWTVPQPLGYLPERCLVLYRAAPGVPVSALPEGAASIAGVLDAARWLATLHRSGVQLPRVLDRGREIESTREWAETVGSHDAALRQPALVLASRWPIAGDAGPTSQDVPLHKDFHAGHVLVDSRVCAVDLDEARLGDPAYDVAHFCTYLDLGDHADSLRRAFLEEYARLTGWSDDVAFASYSAYTWLKIAKQLATRAGPWRTGGADRGWTPAAALARGAACLDR